MKSTVAFNVKMTNCYGDMHLPMHHKAYWERRLSAILFLWLNKSMDIDVTASVKLKCGSSAYWRY